MKEYIMFEASFIEYLCLYPFILPLNDFSRITTPLFDRFVFSFLFANRSLAVTNVCFDIRSRLQT